MSGYSDGDWLNFSTRNPLVGLHVCVWVCGYTTGDSSNQVLYIGFLTCDIPVRNHIEPNIILQY